MRPLVAVWLLFILAAARAADSTSPTPSLQAQSDVSQGERLYSSATAQLSYINARSPSSPPAQRAVTFHSRSVSSVILHLCEFSSLWPFSLARYFNPQTDPPVFSQNPVSWVFVNVLHAIIRVVHNVLDLLQTFAIRMHITDSKSHAVYTQTELSQGMDQVVALFQTAANLGFLKAYYTLGELYLWGNHGLAPDAAKALGAFEASSSLLGDPESQYMAGFIHSSGDWLASSSANDSLKSSQGDALLYYTFSALAGLPEAKMTLAYRSWTGIGTPQSCQDALPLYEALADRAIKTFSEGPPGGRHLPLQKASISVREGGIFGQGASVGPRRPQARSRFRPSYHEWADFLEYYHANAKHGDPSAMFRLGLSYYDGVNFPANTINTMDGIERDFPRAMKWFLRLARSVWPRDPQFALRPGGVYIADKDIKLKPDDNHILLAGMTAGFIGRMYLRGEGVAQDFTKAALWFHRGAGEDDRESHNALGIMYRDGLAVRQDFQKALAHFQAAASANLPDAFVNLGKFYLAIRDPQRAANFFEQAIRHGDTFQSYYYLAQLNSNRPEGQDLCPETVSFYKTVAETGDWGNVAWAEAEQAWALGDYSRALLKYWIVAERGYEVAQDNVAYILDREKSWFQVASESDLRSELKDKLALMFWTRSAAQDNVDSLVKMGDYYLKGLGIPAHSSQPEKAAACYRSAASSHMSALALHNLGWMHENGIGVAKDFHLAKRYYDLSLEADSQAYLPTTLSLIKLHLRSFLPSVTVSDIESLSLFGTDYLTSVEDDDGDPHHHNGAERVSPTPTAVLYRVLGDIKQSVKRIKHDAMRIWWGDGDGDDGGIAEINNVNQNHRDESTINTNNNNNNNNINNNNRRAQLENDAAAITDWQQQQRVASRSQDDDDDSLYDGSSNDDELMETLIFIGLCFVFGWLVYYRQFRQEVHRAERRRADLARAGIERARHSRSQPNSPTVLTAQQQSPISPSSSHLNATTTTTTTMSAETITAQSSTTKTASSPLSSSQSPTVEDSPNSNTTTNESGLLRSPFAPSNISSTTTTSTSTPTSTHQQSPSPPQNEPSTVPSSSSPRTSSPPLVTVTEASPTPSVESESSI